MAGLGMAVAVTAATVTGGAAAALPGLPNGSLGAPTVPKADLDKSFRSLTKSMAKSLPGEVGIAITPVGGDLPTSFGSLTVARAWSTMKVPVAIAAQRARGSAVTADELKAIEVSDNDAAESLWGALGGGRKSVDAVTAVLREGHDSRTRVSSELDEPRSYPGHTPWALTDQSIFAAHLSCMPDTEDVLDFMAHVGKNQQWGVARPKGKGVRSAVKGGWGPVSDGAGKHVVRQLAVVTTPRGSFGVSIAAKPRSGSFSDGTRMVTRVGQWWLRNIGKFAGGSCSPLNPLG
ncbi:hypothetical protein [Gordonia iterans]